MPIFSAHAGWTIEVLEGERYKEVIYPLVDEEYLPQSLGGTYNVNNQLNGPGKIPSVFYLTVSILYVVIPHFRKLFQDWSVVR